MFRRLCLLSWLIIPTLIIATTWQAAYYNLSSNLALNMPVIATVYAEDQWDKQLPSVESLENGAVTIWIEHADNQSIDYVTNLMHTRNLHGIITYDSNSNLAKSKLKGLSASGWNVHLQPTPDTWCIQNYNQRIHNKTIVEKYLHPYMRNQLNITGFDSSCQTLHPLILKQFQSNNLIHRSQLSQQSVLINQSLPENVIYVTDQPNMSTVDYIHQINHYNSIESQWLIIELNAQRSPHELEQILNAVTSLQKPILTNQQILTIDWDSLSSN